jgi:hypothetical protein
MNETAVRQVVRSKIADGTLPRDNIGLVAAATYGLGQMCAACSESVSPRKVLYKLTRAGSNGFVVHSDCFAIWRDERKSMLFVRAWVLD